jgi:hypothetical protein
LADEPDREQRPEPTTDSSPPPAQAETPATTPHAPGPARKSADERKQLLASQLQRATVSGRRIESHQDFQAVLIDGKPVNHTLHAILTIFTCLLWGIVWIVIANTGGEKRELIVIDEWGNLQYQRLGKA